jgi:hypothetical protein
MIGVSIPDRGVVPLVHLGIGAAVVAGWFALMLWGAVSAVIKREPNPWFWRLLAALQVLLALQLLAGLILLALGKRLPGLLHLGYGIVFPVIVLVIAHVLARGLGDEEETWKVFAIAAFFLFGLTLRALTTGLGLP